MSTNINIFAEREIDVVKTVSRQTQREKYRYVWQIPTKDTEKIMQEEDKKQAYINWVLSISKDEFVNTYAEEDVFCDNPIGTKVYNYGKYHIKDFTRWCNYMEEGGYEIKFESW